MRHAHALAGNPLARVPMMRIREPDGHPRGRRGGSPPCPDECSTMWPPIGPPECRPTPARWLRTSPRGRVRLDRGILEEPSRNRRPRAHRDLRPQYSCHFQDSQRPPFPSLRLRGKPRKPFLRLVPSTGPRCPSCLAVDPLSPRTKSVGSCPVTFSWETGELSRGAGGVAPRAGASIAPGGPSVPGSSTPPPPAATR